MRYIKYFESNFKHSDLDKEIEDSMNDYMLPLRDRGFHLNITMCPESYDKIIGFAIGISKYKNRSVLDFKFSEVKEDIFGLIDFMDHSYGINIDVINAKNKLGNIRITNDLSDIKDNDVVDSISLFFKKN